MKMVASEITRSLRVLLHTLCALILSFCIAISTSTAELKSDRYCLKSIKESMEDPRDIFSSWDLDNNKKEGSICQFFGVTCWNDSEDRVLSLELHKWGLKGQFPRGVEKCTSLVGLNLSSNELSGPIPSDISKRLPFLSILDLSHNNFSGEIPPAISNCTFLNTLILSNNQLSGQIPEKLGQLNRIREFSVANNLLTGPVPVFGKNLSSKNYANNSGLCGGPLKSCNSTHPRQRTRADQPFKEGFIVGYFFSATYVIVVYMSFCVPWTKLKPRKRTNNAKKTKQVSERFSFMKGNWDSKKKKKKQMGEWPTLDQLLEAGSKEMSAILERLNISRMSLAELCKATDGFSVKNTIGLGKMGMMYKAWLPNGWFLSVKRLHHSRLFKRQFLSEITVLGRYRHRNIVPLLGFCIERKERILVYQFMSNGRLYDWLHPLESETKKLEWPLRVKIALGIARGLSWLHHSSNLHVAHLSLSTECILLDQNFEPKISNFGEAKFMNQKVDIRTELGFMKKDVYDFGTVLFELITGKKFKERVDSINSSNLISRNSSDFFVAIDKYLIGKGFEAEIFTLLRLACDCVQLFPDQIPTMLEVYNKISISGGDGLISNDCDQTFYQSEIVLSLAG